MNGNFSKLGEEAKSLIEKEGYLILQGSDYCQEFLKCHPSCEGCKSEEGCNKFENALLEISIELSSVSI